ncbi:MAG: helix-turn-helix domain-containing protein [Nannocystaceae bacterium]|nr:helix-turn-helix domain-containing protein [bacterium]
MELSPQHRHAAELLARGESQRQVAAKIAKSPSTIARWAQHPTFSDLVDKIAADREEARVAAPPPRAPVDHDLGQLARQSALQAFGGLVRRMQAGETVASSDWAKVGGLLQKLNESDTDTGLSASAIAGALKDPETAAAALDAMEAVDEAAMLTALREREVERFKRDRNLGEPGVREALIATGRWAPPGVAGQWLARWAPVMELSKADLSRLISRSAHLEVAQQYGDPPDEGYAVIDQRHPVDQIEAVVTAANTPTQKDTDHAPAHDHA